MTGPLKILEMESGRNERRTGDWVPLVCQTAWVRRFTDNCTKPAEQRERGELRPLEL